MTTDPTPHTERAAAAAAELNRTYIIVFSNGDIEDGREVKNQELAAIIAKHFNDDALRLAAGRLISWHERNRDDEKSDFAKELAINIQELDTALSAALAGDKGKETP